ncbi:glycosyl hydrolase family 35 [Kribbella antiqua]|uniref:Glycosyl hydrolase family 35 n=1 Tax=Kribbella antiqua TaxID=2512217 RepID=A0A4R2I852_9ACTN|nr:beta-galactosidase [Kribbella antiqua]TCO40533.1 glycosyl hydrolase family 35 [Kribbella antiqua]
MSSVSLDARGIQIDGQPQVVLCASLFYFRLPREQWRARLEQVRASGYTCVDVYLPWNFHELAPGRWSFEGRRDVAAFLDLAHEVGLYVIARPGPYICSEWDGGALPAWLGLDPSLRVRQNEPAFLTQVAAWFDQVLPLLAARQYGAGGSIIMVQLENELDFFDCEDRTGYITALRELASGIDVPLIACAGQGDLFGATGNVDGVVPACNFYPNDDSPFIEAEVRRYAALLADRGLPLLITETNRRHRTLRRMLASGASLIAPYLQSSGWNFGYTPSSGNWGQPGNFMSHGYDFHGYVSSTGAERPEYGEAQMFARVISALGSRLALATLGDPVEVAADFPTSASPSALDLAGGGRLVAVPNLGDEDGRALVNGVSVAVAADSCPLMLIDFPLPETTLTLASADLVSWSDEGLVFSSKVPVTVVIGNTPVEVAVGATLVVGGVRVTVESPVDVVPAEESLSGVVSTVSRRTATAPAKPAGTHELPPTLESLGTYRGRGTYTATADLTDVDELLLVGASDIVDLSIGGRVQTLAGFGATQRIDVRGLTGDIHATVEIWGHANFDDVRLPSLQLGALRGLGSVWTIVETQDFSALWTVEGHWAGEPAPLRSLTGWSSTRVGTPITYTRRVDLSQLTALHLEGVRAPVGVTIDDGEPITVHTENPWVLLPAGTKQVSITVPHDPSGGGLRAELLTLNPVTDWTCAVQDDELLTAFAGHAEPAVDVTLPLTLAPGEEAWLDVELPASESERLVRVDGAQLRVTGWSSGECIGRVWVGDRPAFSGGDPDVLWIPAGWSELTLLVRGVEGPADAELRTISLYNV